MTINCVTRIPWAKYFVTLLNLKAEQCIEKKCFSSQGRPFACKRTSGLKVSGVAVSNSRRVSDVAVLN